MAYSIIYSRDISNGFGSAGDTLRYIFNRLDFNNCFQLDRAIGFIHVAAFQSVPAH